MNIEDCKPCLLFDGAMGTYYFSKNPTAAYPCEEANLADPQAIADIHAAYIRAGAQAIKTNTFGANTTALNCGFDHVQAVIRAGYALACSAAKKPGARVFADIGPMPAEGAEDELLRIADVFTEAGADAFLLETFGETETVLALSRHIKEKNKHAFILAQFAVMPDGYTRQGVPFTRIAAEMEAADAVDAYGLNCVSGPRHTQENLQKLKAAKKPLSAMPNAGYPQLVGERTFYQSNAAYFASVMAEIRKSGVMILGGCCGTTPEHIAAVKKALSECTEGEAPPKDEKAACKLPKAYNGFYEKLQSGKPVIAVELDPPLDADVSKLMAGARAVKDAGADIITLADNPLARARADSAIMAAKILRECGIETLPHLACRDRNLNAIKAALLALHIEGVRNVLAVTGDPVPEAERTDIKSVFNMNAKLLAAFIAELNQTVFAGDAFAVGAALNINAHKVDLELKRAKEKQAAGVSYFLTQPVFSDAAALALQQAKEGLSAKILAGIMPLVSYRNACFMNNEVSGITIGEDILSAFEHKEKDKAERLGIRLAVDTAKKIAGSADGYYLITPLSRVHVICEIIQKIRSEIF
jgi:homocysteine S-methyltransferase